jgi:hypothetical protein
MESIGPLMATAPSGTRHSRRSEMLTPHRRGLIARSQRKSSLTGLLVSKLTDHAPWELRLFFQVLPVARPSGQSGQDHRLMKRAQLVSIFSRGWMIGRAVFVSAAVVGVLTSPGRASAQDAGVSGIPPGPANARGLNSSVNDPSGIGNAARVPAIPPPAITPVTPPALSPPAAYRTVPMQRAVKIRRTRVAASGSRRPAAGAAVREQDKRLDRKNISICRGC